MMKYIIFFILSFIFWLLLTFNLALANIIVGLAASLITTLFFAKYFFSGVIKIIQPKRYLWLIIYLFIFLWECIKANFDVAYRVLHPNLPIRPGIIKFKTTLVSPLAKTVLANSITLTPGTMTVDSIGEYMYIHWINVKGEREEEWYRHVAGRFEGFIKRIFE